MKNKTILLLLLMLMTAQALTYNYWRQEDEPSTVWVNVTDSIAPGESKTIYISQTNAYPENPNATFSFFDDFNTANFPTEHYTVTGSPTIVNNDIAAFPGSAVATSNYKAFPVSVAFKRRQTSISAKVGLYNGGNTGSQITVRNNQYSIWSADGASSTTYGSWNTNEWYINDFKRNETAGAVYENGTIEESWKTQTADDLLGAYMSGYTAEDSLYVDWVAMRSFLKYEPTATVTDKGNYYEVTITNNDDTTLQNYPVKIEGITGLTGNLAIGDALSAEYAKTLPYNVNFKTAWDTGQTLDNCSLYTNTTFVIANSTTIYNNTNTYLPLTGVPANSRNELNVTCYFDDSTQKTAHQETLVYIPSISITTNATITTFPGTSISFQPNPYPLVTSPSSLLWDFADNTNDTTNLATTHSYSTPGEYNVTLTLNFTGATTSILFTPKQTTRTYGVLVRTYNEINNTQIKFDLSVTNTTTTKNYNQQTNFTWYNYTGFPIGTSTYHITNDSYYYRNYVATYTTGRYVNLKAYLIPTTYTETVYSTFRVQDAGANSIADATILIQKLINNAWVTIAQLTTADDGTAATYLDSASAAKIITSASGYGSQTNTIYPQATTYTITLGEETDLQFTTTQEGYYSYFLPLTNTLNPTDSITYIANDPKGRFNSITLTITNNTNNIVFQKTVTTSPAGVTIQANLTNLTLPQNPFAPITATGTVILNGTEYNQTQIFYLNVTTNTNTSMISGINQANIELEDTQKWFIGILLTIFLTVGASAALGGKTGLFALVIGGMFTAIGWFPLYLYILTATITLAYIFSSERGVKE